MFKRSIILLVLISFIACGGTLNAPACTLNKTVTQKIQLCPDSVYLPIFDSLKRSYNNHKISYERSSKSSQFIYAFLPISLYPFFCMDTIIDKANKVSLYFENQYSIYSYQNQYGSICTEVAMVFYTTDSHHMIYKKIYRLHRFIYNETTGEWSRYQKPLDVIFKASEEKGTFEPVLNVKITHQN